MHPLTRLARGAGLLCGLALWPLLDAPAQSAPDPWAFDISYIGEVWTTLDGGTSNDARYLDNLIVGLSGDLEDSIGWRGTTFYISGLYNNGTRFSDVVGDLQTVSDIETGVEAARLYDAWIEQRFGAHLSLRVGLYSVDAEFDILDTASLFINAAHGTGSVLGLSGVNGPSIFPTTGLGGRLQYQWRNGWIFRLAAVDGVPGNPERLRRTTIRFGDGEGAFLIAELEVPLTQGKLLAGHWRYTAPYDTLDGDRTRGNAGWYVRGEHRLYTDPQDPDRGLNGFIRIGIGNGRVNSLDTFLSGGLVYTGALPTRPSDRCGIAFASARASHTFKRVAAASGTETAIELSYSAQLTSWLRLQPDLQYIINPSTNPARENVLAAGFRFELSWSY